MRTSSPCHCSWQYIRSRHRRAFTININGRRGQPSDVARLPETSVSAFRDRQSEARRVQRAYGFGAPRNLSTRLRHRRLEITEQAVVWQPRPAG